MNSPKRFLLSASAVAIAAALAPTASALQYDFYGSLRIQGEAVEPHKTDTLDSYVGLRDAYSRIGFSVTQDLNEDFTAYGKLELPFDSANLAVQDPWDQAQDIRIGKVGVKGKFGDLAVGQMWMPYYNAIAYPVDMFSTYYSGFATYTTFRKGDTVSYYTPSFAGFSAAGAYSLENGALKANGKADDRWQATLSYNYNDITAAVGVDYLGGVDDYKIWGGSLAWQATDALYIGAKYEMQDSDLQRGYRGYGRSGDSAKNIYAGYTIDKFTIKGMFADVDNYGEDIYHAGVDYQYRDDLKFFVEYYSEQQTAAITTKRGGLAETCWACDGGQVVAAGLRYDFGAP